MSARQSTETAPPSSTPTVPAVGSEPSSDAQERIRAIAYQLYEARGRSDGYDVDDWLQAEEQVLGSAQKGAA
jgi:hypothetical protein